MQDATPIPSCLGCRSARAVRNGRIRSGTPNFLDRGCHRRFVPRPRKGPMSDDRQELVRRLLRARMSLRGIARVTGLSRSWLQAFVNALYRGDTPWEPGPLRPPKKSRANS